jgi:glycosyltransferase involved in cell wall biosynthesis
MIKNMSISAVITTCNRSHLLGRSITSILSQSSPVSEIIVIDDSFSELYKTRNSEICNSFDCNNIHYFQNTKNMGVTRSRNLGLTKVSSKFVMFLDDDDEWRADRVELLLQNYSDKYAYITGLNLNCLPTGKSYFRRKKVLHLKNILFGNFSGHMPLVKTERLLQLGGFDENLPSANDWDMWIRPYPHIPIIR